VLVAAGIDSSFLASGSAELYNPVTGTWTATGNLNNAREEHTATLLFNGMALAAGGFFDSGNAELYDPASGMWTLTGNLNDSRAFHTAILLPNGKVLAAGGTGLTVLVLASAELYNGPTPPPGCTVTSTTCGRTVVGTGPTEFTVNLSDPADPATVQASDFTVNGTPADNDIISNGDLTITFHFNSSPVVGGQNTMLIPAGGFDCGQGPVQEFTCTFFYRVAGATPPPRPRPTPRVRPTPP
jgi:hypothetical protein